MTFRDYFETADENMEWCRPYISENERVKLIVMGGIESLIIDDKEYDTITPDLIHKAALIATDGDYDLFSGYSDTDLIIMCSEEQACYECPWFDECQAMDEIIDEPIY